MQGRRPTAPPFRAWSRLLAVIVLATAAVPIGCDTDSPEPEDVEISDVQVLPSPSVGTVVTVRWTTDRATDGQVEYGPDASLGSVRASAATAATEHEVVLAGLLPASEYHYRIRAIVEGQTAAETGGTFVTGSPPQLPSVEVTLGSGEAGPPAYVAVPLISSPIWIAILDTEGRYRWWHEEDRPDTAVGRVLLARDGTSVLYNVFPQQGLDPTQYDSGIVRVSLDGESTETVDTPLGHHDFTELADGTLAYLAIDRRQIGDATVDGDRIVEVRPDGTEVEIWSVWDDFTYEGTEDAELTHANAIDHDPVEDVYYVSLCYLDQIAKIDRATGELLWSFGGDSPDFALSGTAPFHQHQFQVLDQGLLIFDNGTVQNQSSRAVEFLLDPGNGSASESWSFELDPPMFNFAMGDVQRLPSGNTRITWSVLGQIDEVTTAGETVWRLNTAIGAGIGYATWLDDI